MSERARAIELPQRLLLGLLNTGSHWKDFQEDIKNSAIAIGQGDFKKFPLTRLNYVILQFWTH